MRTKQPITIVGAGPAGSLMAILLGNRGIPVRVLECRPDIRKQQLSAGRSINLALADRGIHALKVAGVHDAIIPLTISMPGRCIHDLTGSTQFVRYGQHTHEVIYSISRTALNQVLLDHAERLPSVELHFSTACKQVDLNHHRLIIEDINTSTVRTEHYSSLIAADGAHSAARQALMNRYASPPQIDVLPHGYKELTLPAHATGVHQLEKHALHIWPRGGFMLIALPNLDGSFTVTLFLPFDDPANPDACFSGLQTPQQIHGFFLTHFADALSLMPNLVDEFIAHPTGKMSTIRTAHWTDRQDVVLIGDAAHAIVPFHGQGMNCAFEDCVELDQLMQHHESAFNEFEKRRQPNTNAIADMALENYIEMRDTIRDAKFQLQKDLSFVLERAHPKQFIPRYSMVMFHHEIPYIQAYERGRIQAEILDQLTTDAQQLASVDLQQAEMLINSKLAPW